jgi:hypothetical protein
MNVASARLDELARRLARLTGEDVETAVERAIEERLSRVAPAAQSDRRAAMQRFFDRSLGLPVRGRDNRLWSRRFAFLMVLDTSAIVAAIVNEPDADRFQNAIFETTSLTMSAVAVLESRIVLQSRYGRSAVEAFDEMLEQDRDCAF